MNHTKEKVITSDFPAIELARVQTHEALVEMEANMDYVWAVCSDGEKYDENWGVTTLTHCGNYHNINRVYYSLRDTPFKNTNYVEYVRRELDTDEMYDLLCEFNTGEITVNPDATDDIRAAWNQCVTAARNNNESWVFTAK